MENQSADAILKYLSGPNLIPLGASTFLESIISLCFAGLFGWLISLVYTRFSHSLTGGRRVKGALLPLTLIVFLTISIIKSSLALSLGLVGALSIVRFRTPIKDPEDLVFLFLAIVAGLGFGANQNTFTSLGLGVILALVIVRSALNTRSSQSSSVQDEYSVVLDWPKTAAVNFEQVIISLSEICDYVSLVRFDSLKDKSSLVLQLAVKETASIELVVASLNKLDSNIEVQIADAGVDW